MTIYALSSGSGISGVAVIRVGGATEASVNALASSLGGCGAGGDMIRAASEHL